MTKIRLCGFDTTTGAGTRDVGARCDNNDDNTRVPNNQKKANTKNKSNTPTTTNATPQNPQHYHNTTLRYLMMRIRTNITDDD